ncbi:unnamed protein product [Heligmosomoides polygyrus]|uniref:RNase NYN domain-containing protein n=1 Tax=Heligmosomoides polygyrus TaxID=6339 RepID=A0A183GKS3_HELPZ|nr:unnamed protein product [Heligmosomoides polygyrus]
MERLISRAGGTGATNRNVYRSLKKLALRMEKTRAVNVLEPEPMQRYNSFKWRSLTRNVTSTHEKHTLLGCVVDPARTVAEFRPDEMKHVIFRSELHESLAMAALYSENWDVFSLERLCRGNMLLQDVLVRSKLLRQAGLEPALSAFPAAMLLLTPPALKRGRALGNAWVCGSTPEMVTVTNSGRVVPSSGESGFSLPNEEPFREQDFLSLKSSLNGLLNELSKGSGSVTRKEVAAMRQSIRSWSKADGERAVVIDSLNVFHGSANGITALVSLANRSVFLFFP